jgi:hypothetical protein
MQHTVEPSSGIVPRTCLTNSKPRLGRGKDSDLGGNVRGIVEGEERKCREAEESVAG